VQPIVPFEPEAYQVSAALRIRVIFERRPVVENPAVINEVDLAGLEPELGP
jgi:hypothetical protein